MLAEQSDKAAEVAALPDPDSCRSFERLIRLVGLAAFNKLQSARVMIVGVGGVGSWASEALVRMGIGNILLVDFDRIASSNLNRQLPATSQTVGQSKVEVMAERLRIINPRACIDTLELAYSPATSASILAYQPQVILDAIDNITYKCHLLASAQAMGIPIVTSTGAAGRFSTTSIRIADLSHTKVDPVALQVRKKLRKDYGYPGNKSFHIPAVYSEEVPISPIDTSQITGFPHAAVPQSEYIPAQLCAPELDEDDYAIDEHPTRKAPPYGTASYVTGAFGLAAAGVLSRIIMGLDPLA